MGPPPQLANHQSTQRSDAIADIAPMTTIPASLRILVAITERTEIPGAEGKRTEHIVPVALEATDTYSVKSRHACRDLEGTTRQLDLFFRPTDYPGLTTFLQGIFAGGCVHNASLTLIR